MSEIILKNEPITEEMHTLITEKISLYMQDMMSDVRKSFSKFYAREDFFELIEELKKEKGKSSYKFRKAELDAMFMAIRLNTKAVDNIVILESIVREHCKGREVIKKELIKDFVSKYKEFPKSEDFMKRIVHRLGGSECLGETVRLSIVKRFVKYTDYYTAAVKKIVVEQCINSGIIKENHRFRSAEQRTEFVFDNIDDSVFEVAFKRIEEASTTKKKDELKDQYRLLRLADDLANSRFITNGRTKTDLYLFAMAYDMTYFIDETDDFYDEQRDIQKNLFEDYYNNNLLRFLSESYKKNPGIQEKEPSGEGINYKNYAEAIYLYCLRKYENPKEKIKKAEELISRCKKSNIQRDYSLINEDDYTFDYRISFVDNALKFNEDDLVEYICRNYEIDRSVGAGSPITVANEQKMAFDNYNNLVGKIKKLYKDDLGDILYDATFLKYLKYFKVYNENGANEIVSIVGSYLNDDNLFSLEDATQMTRTILISVYFYYFQLDEKYNKYAKSVSDLYVNFCNGVNKILEDSRYQKISEKNIFDMSVFFAIYMNKN